MKVGAQKVQLARDIPEQHVQRLLCTPLLFFKTDTQLKNTQTTVRGGTFDDQTLFLIAIEFGRNMQLQLFVRFISQVDLRHFC